jgi:Phosphotransferase enzyme family
VRARGLVAGPPSRLVTEAVERAAGRDVDELKLALYSATGQSLSKAACFVFEEGADEPLLVVKVMPEPGYADRLRHETEIIESFRQGLGPSAPAADALPLAPSFAGTVGADYVVVQGADPLAAGTGLVTRPADALAWLREFQAGTTTTVRPWVGEDSEAALEPVRYAWERARPEHAAGVITRARRLLQALEGRLVPRCGVHGDFWRDNIAQVGGRLRIYDWEWAEPEGPPFFDLWTSELGLLRRQAEEGRPRLLEALGEALARVSVELDRRGLDARFAPATLAPSLGHLVFRVRRATGVPGGAETESVRLLAAAEALLE